MLLFACAEVLSGYIYDTVCVDIESNLDLRYAAHCGRDSVQSELAEGLVVSRELSLTLKDVDVNSGLVVSCCGEHLALLGRDSCISLDQRGSDAAHGLDGKCQRCDIKQKDVACACIACKLAALDSSADRDALIGVQGLAGLVACKCLYLFLYARDSCGTADQQYFAQIGVVQACVSHGVLNRNSGLLYEVADQLFEFSSCEVLVEVLGAFRRSCDERKVDVGGCRAGQLLLCLLCSFLHSLKSHLVAGEVDALFCLELTDDPVDDPLVEVIAAQACIAVGGQNFDDAVADLDDGNIECTAAQVIDHDLLLFLVVQAVSQCCSCGLVDDSLYFKAGDLACVLGCLSLRIVEVCGNSDDCLCDLLAQIALCVRFQLLQDHSGDLLRGILLAVDGAAAVCSHVSLNRRDRVVSVCNCLTLCGLTYKSLAVLCESDDGRCGPCALCICDNCRLSAFHNCYAAVCCTKIDTDNLTHCFLLYLRLSRSICNCGLFPKYIRLGCVFYRHRAVIFTVLP